MTNTGSFAGTAGSDPIFHSSAVDAASYIAQTHNILGPARVNTSPGGTVKLIQPFKVSTLENPNVAWSRTEGTYDQSH